MRNEAEEVAASIKQTADARVQRLEEQLREKTRSESEAEASPLRPLIESDLRQRVADYAFYCFVPERLFLVLENPRRPQIAAGYSLLCCSQFVLADHDRYICHDIVQLVPGNRVGCGGRDLFVCPGRHQDSDKGMYDRIGDLREICICCTCRGS